VTVIENPPVPVAESRLVRMARSVLSLGRRKPPVRPPADRQALYERALAAAVRAGRPLHEFGPTGAGGPRKARNP
jgi:hypothetical protein